MATDSQLARAARRAVGLSPAVFADLIGVTLARIIGWESGGLNLSKSERNYLRVILANPEGIGNLVKVLRLKAPPSD